MPAPRLRVLLGSAIAMGPGKADLLAAFLPHPEPRGSVRGGIYEHHVGDVNRCLTLNTPPLGVLLASPHVLVLQIKALDEDLVRDTLNVILKYEGDIKKAQSELGRLITRKAEEEVAASPVRPAPAPTPAAPAAPKPPAKKGTLH